MHCFREKRLLRVALVSGGASLLMLCGCQATRQSLIVQARSQAAVSRQSLQEAIKSYQEILQEAPKAAKVRLELARLYYQNGYFREALDALSPLLPKDGRGGAKGTEVKEAWRLAALSYYRQADFTASLFAFEQAGQLMASEDLYYYGLACEALNLYKEARENYARISSGVYFKEAQARLAAIDKREQAGGEELAPFVREAIRNSPGGEEYPQAGAVVLKVEEKAELLSNNTAVYDEYFLVKVLNERGKEKFAEVVINYDSTYERIELVSARTIKPDGTVIPVGDKHIRDVSRYLNFPLYSNARARIISMPEVTNGAVIEYRFRLFVNRLVAKKEFSLSYIVQADEPIKEASFSVIIPKDRKLYCKVKNEEYNKGMANLKPRVETFGDGRLVYAWHFRDISQIMPESSMPPQAEINPTILLSTLDSWQGIYTWWQEVSRDKIVTNETMRSLVKELTKAARDPYQKAKYIYFWVLQNIRYVAIEYGDAGFEPHLATEVFQNKYGDCKDQAVLLTALLREAGLKAYLVLIPTRGMLNLSEDFPMLDFNHCIAVVRLGEQYIFLDPTSQTATFGDLPVGDQGRQVLVFLDDHYEIMTTPVWDFSHNRIQQEMEFTISQDEEVQAVRKVSTFGVYDQGERYWLMYTPPQLIEDALRRKVYELLPGGQLEGFRVENVKDLDKTVTLSFSFTGKEYVVKAGDLRILPSLGYLDLGFLAKDKRAYPLDFEYPSQSIVQVSLRLPQAWKVYFLPRELAYTSPALEYKARYWLEQDTLHFREEKTVKLSLVPLEDYAKLKQDLEGLAKEVSRPVVFTTGGDYSSK